MLADSDNNIVYLNQAVVNMLRNAASDIRKDLPHFDAENLLGKNIDIFHANPDHQRNMLAHWESTYATKIGVGGRYFNLIATPVKDTNNARIGTAVEWSDIGAQVKIEHEVEQLVTDVNEGRLGALLSTDEKHGFPNISNKLNALSQTVHSFVRDISQAMQALANGKLNIDINDYKGEFGDVAFAFNDTLAKLNNVLGSIKPPPTPSAHPTKKSALARSLSTRTEKQASNLEETAASLKTHPTC